MPVKIAAALSLIATAALSVLMCWMQLTTPSNPEAVLSVWPQNAAALTRKAETMRQSGGAPKSEIKRLGERLLRSYPLSEAPLVFAADSFQAQGDFDKAGATYRAALSRQPRNIPALTSWTASAIEAGQFREAIQLLHSMATINPNGTPVYVDTLMAIASSEAGALAFEESLRNESKLAQQALNALNQTETDAALLLRYNAYAPDKAGPLIRRILSEQGPEMAFVAWFSLLPSSDAVGFAWPYDPKFLGGSAPPPFAWNVSRDAELQLQGGLYASHSGRGKQRIQYAQQTILLSPGLYTLLVEMDGKVERDAAFFEWTVTCLEDGELIGRLPVKSLDIRVEQFEAFVSVPNTGCSAQVVEFAGLSGPYPIRSRAIVRSISIDPVRP
ncbi:MAG: hypothetical protein AAFZ74_18800 [Pseudomonadota bacterium]